MDSLVEKYLEQQAVKGIDLVKSNVSIEPEDPHTIEMDQALVFIDEKKRTDEEKEIRLVQGSTIQILDGRWGPFITDGFKNAKIPKDREPESLKLDECESILAETTKVKKRIGQQFYGGGFDLIKNPGGRPDATIKVADNKLEKAVELLLNWSQWEKKYA